MSVSFDFHLLGFRLAGLEINVDEPTDKLPTTGVDSAVNRTIKWFSRKWTTRMAS